MNVPVNGIRLRQHVPMGAGIEYPKRCFEKFAGGYRLTTGTTFGNVLFREVLPDPSPLLVAQSNHGRISSALASIREFELGPINDSLLRPILRLANLAL